MILIKTEIEIVCPKYKHLLSNNCGEVFFSPSSAYFFVVYFSPCAVFDANSEVCK